MISRREWLLAGTAATLFARTPDKALMGGTPTAFSIRTRAAKQKNEIFDVVEHCHQLGLVGAESGLFKPTPEAIQDMRRKVDGYGMHVIVNIPLPKTESDVAQFEAAVKGAKEAGVMALHAAMTARRYEQFDTLDAFKANFAQCQKSVELAEPVLQRNRMRLAIENHKGWRAVEQAAWMKRVSSEWVGVCLDMGNNLSLCEVPDETFDALVPYAIFSHIKDMGLQDYPDGFLLSEVPFGQGVIDLRERVTQLRRKDPNMLFCLEMITRDPLQIPVFTAHYWKTFSDRETEIPGQDLARVLEMVRKNPPKAPLPTISGLSLDEQVKLEDKYNLACIEWARQNLNM